MKPLSNFLRKSRAAPGTPAASALAARGTDLIHCRRARREELQAALRLILASAGPPVKLADETQVNDFIRFAAHRNIAVAETHLAERRGRLLWAMLPILSPGRTALLLSPPGAPAPPGAPDAAAGPALLEAVCADLASRNVQLAQALLDPADVHARALFTSHGFQQMAELIYLQMAIRRPVPPPALPAGFAWVTYMPTTHAHFADAIAESYHDSLDCPGLNGLREIEDVVAGHQASGEFDPALWFLLREHVNGGAALTRAVLLLSRMPRSDAMELVYLGLTPAARGRGLGDLVMRQCLYATAAQQRQRLSLAVDAGNAPALKLYYRHGMQRVGSKLAMMREMERRT